MTSRSSSTDTVIIDDTVDRLRRRVLDASLTLLAIVMPLASVTLIVSAASSGTLNLLTVTLASSMLVFPLLRLASGRLGFRRSAITLVAFVALSAFILASRGLLTVGYACLCLLTIQLASLFFGRRGLAAGLGAIVTLHVVAWFMIQNDIGPPIDLELWDPHTNTLWLRHLIILTLLGLLIALGELFMLERLTQALALQRDAAVREKAQRLALEEAERVHAHERSQRELAQQAVERSHRIEALARVAGSVAHDFNNALTVILGTAEAAKMDAHSPEDVETYMDEIVEAVQHASVLTGQLLTLGRQQISTPAPVSVMALLGRLRPAIARVLPADVSIVIDMPTDDAFVQLDETGFHRAILNLALNARDAMPRGGTIAISGRCDTIGSPHPELPAGRYATIQVSDDGVGMDADTLARIFDPFFTTKGEKGTGLGLASVHAFVREAGGGIDVQSQAGRGTTFTLWFPTIDTVSTPADTMPATTLTTKGERRSGSILIAEDRDDVRTTMRRILQLEGFDVLEARSGDEALAILEGHPPVALMCIDGVMPGLSTAKTIERARVLAPEMRVIVCSAHVQEELLRRGIETGRYDFLAKPFAPRELVTRVARALAEDATREPI